MNYFEIINAVLLEMNYPTVSSFADLTKIEHKRLMNIINRLNKEICSLNDRFYFRERVKMLNLYPGKIEYNVNLSGKISKIIGKNFEYIYEPDYSKFFAGNDKLASYSTYGEKYLFSSEEDVVRIFYSTNDFVVSNNGELKADFEVATDCSIIPNSFVEKLFINGVAYNFKQNTTHPKYIHWKNEYELALKELVASAKKVSNINSCINGGFRKL